MENWIKSSLVGLVGIFAPIYMVMFSAGFLIFVDLITGCWKSVKQGQKITSAGWRRTVTKMCVYQIALMSGFLAEIYLLDNVIPVSKIVASAIGMTELLSIVENIEFIYGEPIFKKLIKKLGSVNDKQD
jgi:phage-related holin